ncbi:hypothetical protein AC229_0544 [Oenococcus oeni]|nr:hypothetical protein AC229_0544 [Oenococcus oeni]
MSKIKKFGASAEQITPIIKSSPAQKKIFLKINLFSMKAAIEIVAATSNK